MMFAFHLSLGKVIDYRNFCSDGHIVSATTYCGENLGIKIAEVVFCAIIIMLAVTSYLCPLPSVVVGLLLCT